MSKNVFLLDILLCKEELSGKSGESARMIPLYYVSVQLLYKIFI